MPSPRTQSTQPTYAEVVLLVLSVLLPIVPVQLPVLPVLLLASTSSHLNWCTGMTREWTRGRFHEKSQFETSFGLSLGLKSETFVSAEFLAQIGFTKGDSTETGLSHSLNF